MAMTEDSDNASQQVDALKPKMRCSCRNVAEVCLGNQDITTMSMLLCTKLMQMSTKRPI
ncbi:hypothetical protein COCC4DRAFT_33774 [Bipolaris maydis ATCC 48331]|uniref:Uncharacterized protein n=2 Tax=Cochliobolus heterostrophus TaxID=5016 RepID=M2V4P9_COCH5|nr:uncharacterized protein COCC4DRAFT_33774 [Bipolaris maydis ATCC 48331]EMD94983.1 hypothetical protein COCHEDRAFT_1019875 [Bipolaris maydis C5]ENI01726.1 hypothetical protein COCC4DRAFT_33774 [Bipolaris maydis ATCC 48331]